MITKSKKTLLEKNDTITVYWSPALFSKDEVSWDLIYSEPESLLTRFIENKTVKAPMGFCPATKEMLRKLYAITSNIDDEFEIINSSPMMIDEIPGTGVPIGNGKVSFHAPRESSFDGYINAEYNIKYLMFATEPLKIRLTSPFFPNSEICPGSMFSPGEMDIGKWYRPINLDWHIPSNTKSISIKKNQDLAYIEFFTDKKIKFQRYTMTKRLAHLSDETAESGNRYGKFMSLQERYGLAEKAGLKDLVLSEIQKNIV